MRFQSVSVTSKGFNDVAKVGIDNNLTSELAKILDNNEIQPGSDVGYELCKLIWQFHPLGGKLVEKPIDMAMCKPRRYIVDTDPDERVVRQFEAVFKRMRISEKVKNFFYVSRCYGAAAIGVGTIDGDLAQPLGTFDLTEEDIFINVFDPLNAAGSLVTSQDPNSPLFQEPNKSLTIASVDWHSSRTLTLFHGAPIYLEYQNSAFGFTGRSVFQRCLYPLKSYISTMIANNLVAKKAGVLVAKTEQNGTIASGLMALATRTKRLMLKEAENEGVISIGTSDDIESLNLQNIDGALKTARDNIISDIAAAADVPANLIREEAYAQGFSDGKEDSKATSQYVDGIRQLVETVLDYFEKIVMYVAWTEEFYEALKTEYPEIITEDFKTTFYRWQREFRAEWQELVEESPDKRRESDKALVDGAIQLVNAMLPELDPENKAAALVWLADVANSTKTYGETPLTLDEDAIAEYEPPSLGFNAGGEGDFKSGQRPPRGGLENDGVSTLDPPAEG